MEGTLISNLKNSQIEAQKRMYEEEQALAKILLAPIITEPVTEPFNGKELFNPEDIPTPEPTPVEPTPIVKPAPVEPVVDSTPSTTISETEQK